MNMTKYIAALLLAALPSVPAMAQENTVNSEARDLENPLFGQPGVQASVNSGYDWSSSTKFQGGRVGDSDAYNINIGVGAHITLNDKWFVQLSLMSDNFYLEQLSAAPIPDAINTLRLNAGLGYRLNDKWTITALASPSFYRFDNVNGDDVGVAGSVMAAFRASPKLSLVFGIIGSPDSDAPVLPILGAHWRINDRYLVELGVPRTRMSYYIEKNWAVYAGGNLNGTIFRAGDTLGTQIGQSQYNNALGYYRDIRAGVGTSCEIIHGFRAEFEGGYSVYRDIDYTRVDTNVRFRPSPYVRLALSYRF